MEYRLLAVDLDNTLVTGLTGVSQRNREALRQAEQAGCRVTICTARGRFTTRPVLRELPGLPGPHILFNGATTFSVLECDPDEVLIINRETLQHCIEVARPLKLGLSGFEDPRLGDVVYLSQATDGLRRWAKSNRERVVWVERPEEILSRDLVAFVFWGTEEQARQLHARLGRPAELSPPRLGVSRHLESCLVELTAEGATKGQALARLAVRLGVPRTSVLAIGDAPADVGMIRYAGLGVAVGNASDEVKAAADHVAPPAEDDGVAWAVERFILQQDSHERDQT